MQARDGPAPLSALLDQAVQDIPCAASATERGDGFLFSGNRHETVPRRLFLDTRLTPLERNAWQIFRLLLNHDGVTAFPTYDALQPYLASMPCGAKASHETIARTLTVLRLTRWLSLVRRRRDRKTGRILGNLYVLHDEPLTPYEAIQLDPEYLGLAGRAIEHSSRSVQIVGIHALQEIADDPMLKGRVLPSRVQVLIERLAQRDPLDAQSCPQQDAVRESEEGPTSRLRIRETPSSESEAGRKPAPERSLRNPKQVSTVRSSKVLRVRTTETGTGKKEPEPRVIGPPAHLRLPDRFEGLKEAQQSAAIVALQQLDVPQQQAVLDEWDARCAASGVRSPGAYLLGIIQKALRGEFMAWAAQRELEVAQPPPPPPAPPHEPYTAPDPEFVRRHIARLKDRMLRR